MDMYVSRVRLYFREMYQAERPCALFTYHNRTVNYFRLILRHVHVLSFEAVVRRQRVSIISFGARAHAHTHTLLYHETLFDKHAAGRFIIRRGSEYTGVCVDNDVWGEKRSQTNLGTMTRFFAIAPSRNLNVFAIKKRAIGVWVYYYRDNDRT